MAVKAGKIVIDALNDILTAELTGINQYFLHAKMLGHMGFVKLAGKVRAESIDEMNHADQLIERILYLDGVPNVQKLGRVRIGETVPEMFASDLELERDAIPRLNAAIALCVEQGDNGTRHLLEEILTSEETHLDWLETQQGIIEQIGVGAYLSQQLEG
jgi:bacterioferritin